MPLTRRELFLNTIYSLFGSILIFAGVYWGIKYSLYVSVAYGTGFFLWSELFLYALKILSDNNENHGGNP